MPSIGPERGGRQGLVFDQQESRRGTSQLSRHDQDIPGTGAAAGDEVLGAGRVAGHGHGEGEDRRPGQVAAGDRRAGLGRDRRHPLAQLEQLRLAHALGRAEHDVGLARLCPHRRQVRERGGERLAADLAQRGGLAAEVDALDQRVDRGRDRAARHRDRRVVAAAEHEARARRRQPLAKQRQQLELTHGATIPEAGPCAWLWIDL